MRCAWNRAGMSFVICLELLSAAQAHAQRTVAEQYFAMSVNEARAAAGLPALAWNSPLAFAAHKHAERMAAANTMAHQLRGELKLSERVALAGAGFPALAENVGVGPSPAELHRALMESPHHRENILDPKLNSVGIAVVFARGSLWVVEDFARDLPKIPLADQEEQVARLVQSTGLLEVIPTPEARAMCGMSSGFVGTRPAFTMRYTADSLNRLPDELLARLSEGRVAWASVGACKPSDSGLYNLAVVLYR
jgi:hypothetical protein